MQLMWQLSLKGDDVVRLSIGKGVDINSTKRRSGITPLLLASCFNNIDMIKLLIENGADINIRDNSGMGAKDYAKKLGQKRVVEVSRWGLGGTKLINTD